MYSSSRIVNHLHGKVMKTLSSTILCFLLAALYSTAEAACPSEPGCLTDWLNVPGDFSNSTNYFTMNLLGGQFQLDAPEPGGGWSGGGPYLLNTAGNQIDFTASQFDNSGPGQGTSLLDANLNHYVISSSIFLGLPLTVYIDGTATGTLVDNASSTQGNWTLNTHLYADVATLKGIDLGVIPLSTSATFYYADNQGDICYDNIDSCLTTSGSMMDYHSGLAYLVGQSVMQSGPLTGFRVTIGLEGQDPLANPVPVPAAVWLLGSGLLGLLCASKNRVQGVRVLEIPPTNHTLR